MQRILSQLSALLFNTFGAPSWRTVLDILAVAVIIYQVLKLFIHTRANSVLKGVIILIVVLWLSEALGLNAVNWVLRQVMSAGAVLLVVLFQPELRRGLEHIGRTGFLSRLMSSRQDETYKRQVDELVNALSDLSRKRIGALIVIERMTGLGDIVESGTLLDAEISAALIENIFEPNTPLHDGAVILRGGRIVAAACILQLTEDNTLSRELGTRHRAAIGVSETTDAISLIVSEETGIISTAQNGRLTRYLDKKSLTALLTGVLVPKEWHISDLFKPVSPAEEGQPREGE